MKKRQYNVLIEFSQEMNDIQRATCTCPAGLGVNGKGKCNHIGGVLFAIEDFTRQGLHKHNEPLSCTSRLSVWVVPRLQTVTPRPVDQILFRRIRFGKQNIRKEPLVISYDPRASYQRTRIESDFKKLCTSLQNCLASSSFFLFHDLQSNRKKTNEHVKSIVSCDPELPFNDYYDISSMEFQEITDCYFQSHYIRISTGEIEEIEKNNRGKQRNTLWIDKRKQVLTASNFGMAAKTKVEPSKKVNSILYSNFTTEAILYGLENEHKAVEAYVSQEKANGCNCEATEVGLLISSQKPYLGASLDRIIVDKSSNKKWGLEVKCPISKIGLLVEEACKTKTFFLKASKSDGKISLKRNHNYFYQLQGQLFVSGLEFIDFVVYFGDNLPLFVERVYFDQVFWNQNISQQLAYFFKKALLPEMFTQRVKRGKVLYLHGGWQPLIVRKKDNH